MVTEELEAIFRDADCEGGTPGPVARRRRRGRTTRREESVVPASVFKVQVALEAETWFADGRLDPRERVTLGHAARTPGPVGFSLFDDEVTLSWRDMVVLMLTISDNPCTDALLRRVGVDAVNVTAARLGLTGTVVESTLMATLDTIGEDLGRADWRDLATWAATASPEEHAAADELLMTSRALDPEKGTRTTPRDMVTLLRLIWSDRAGPAAACERVRAVMARQLTKHRIAGGFGLPVRVAAKSGSVSDWLRDPQ
jgi:beta-lactamase class A